MFWNGNYTTREVSTLLKEEDVTLTQLLEADDIIQECQAKNMVLVKFLTRTDVMSSLVSLITEEPSPSVELSAQYRHASLAAEVLTSGIALLNDSLSANVDLMHRLCDFIAKEPPLNPLLASFFSKTVKGLLEQTSKQDWYSYQIICLRVLEFFRSRNDFLPNLFRHIGTSAILDVFKFLIRLDIAHKFILQWLESHQLMDVLIHMICGTFIAEKLRPPVCAPPPAPSQPPPQLSDGDAPKENGQHIVSSDDNTGVCTEGGAGGARVVSGRAAAATALLCDIILTGSYGESGSWFPQSCVYLTQMCKSERFISHLLQSVFTSPPQHRRDAIVGCCQVLLCAYGERTEAENGTENSPHEEARRAVVSAIAPHLPLLHQTLLHNPAVHTHPHTQNVETVGVSRLQVATLLASLMGSPAEEVAGALLALGTPGALLDLMLACPGCNLLHAQVYRALRAALASHHASQYMSHLVHECDILNRLMDIFEANEPRENGPPRSGYMGHVMLILEMLQQTLDERACAEVGLAGPVLDRWQSFLQNKMQPLFRLTPLGGYHPANESYEEEGVSEISLIDNVVSTSKMEDIDMAAIMCEDTTEDNAEEGSLSKYYANYCFNIPMGGEEGGEESGGAGAGEQMEGVFDDDFDNKDWTEYSTARRLPFNMPQITNTQILDYLSPWGPTGGGASGAEEAWACFSEAECLNFFTPHLALSEASNNESGFADFEAATIIEHSPANVADNIEQKTNNEEPAASSQLTASEEPPKAEIDVAKGEPKLEAAPELEPKPEVEETETKLKAEETSTVSSEAIDVSATADEKIATNTETEIKDSEIKEDEREGKEEEVGSTECEVARVAEDLASVSICEAPSDR